MKVEPLSRCRSALLLAVSSSVLALLLPGSAAAQSDAASVFATVNVVSSSISVTGLADLDFGTHFPSEGVITNEAPGAWNVDTGGSPASVDLVFTQLPSSLSNGVGTVAVTYGVNSLAASCNGGVVQADPLIGIGTCLIDPAPGGANVVLGEALGFSADELVSVDLSTAAGLFGPYEGIVELTATLN